MTFILSREADIDLAEIEDYTALTWGDEQAERYINEIFGALTRLAGKPALGRSRWDIPPPYLMYAAGSHLIVYRCNLDRVEVLNILHPSMNVEKRVRDALKRMQP